MVYQKLDDLLFVIILYNGMDPLFFLILPMIVIFALAIFGKKQKIYI